MSQEILIQKIDKVILLIEKMNDPSWINYVNIFCTLLIAIIAFVSIYMSIKNFKISQRSEKIEEIFTLIEEFAHYYSGFLPVYNDLQSYHGAKDSSTQKIWLENYNKSRNELLNKIDKVHLFKNQMKLEILARAYLCKKLKIRVLSFNRMFRDLLDCTLNMNWIAKEMFWNEGFPNIDKFNEYVDDLEKLLIDEIGSSNEKKNFRSKMKKYTEKEFKKDLGIK